MSHKCETKIKYTLKNELFCRCCSRMKEYQVRKFNIFISLIRIYFLDKFSFNSCKFRRLKRERNSEYAVIYIAPSNLNSQIDGDLVPDKLHDIILGLESNGIKSVYLIRYYLELKESLPFSKICRNDSILQVRIRLYKFFGIMYQSLNALIAKKVSNNDYAGKQKLLTTFLNKSLEDTLRELRPTFVVSIGATQEFLSICKSLDIKVIEVMHGVLYREEILKEWGSSIKLKPSLFFTWHDYYTQILLEFGVNAKTLGYPKINLAIPQKKYRSKMRILITLGYSHFDFRNPMAVLDEKLFLQLKRLECPETELIFRVHPVVSGDRRLRKRVIHLLNENFENSKIHLPWEKTLFDSFMAVDFHITSNSSSYFEAALFGIPTVFTEDINSLQIPSDFYSGNFVIQGGSLNVADLLALQNYHLISPIPQMHIEDFLGEVRKLI
jgi:hypothetical protein